MVGEFTATPTGARMTLADAQALASALVPLCDRREAYAGRMEQDGFAAFRPRQEFEESFCATPEEQDRHRRHATELAKEWLGARLLSRLVLLFPDRDTALAAQYKSPAIDQMMRDAPHVDRADSRARWLCEPANWKNERVRREEHEAHEQRWEAMISTTAEQFHREVTRHSSGMGDRFEANRSGRRRLFLAAAEHYGQKLGFHYDRKKSSNNEPAVVAAITNDWELRWTLGNTDRLVSRALISRDVRKAHPWFATSLLLCGKDQPGQISAWLGEVLEIDYRLLVPSFSAAYAKFFDNDELEVNVMAHMTLLSYVMQDIISAIKAIVGSHGSN